ncbi:GTPase family protein [Ectothiorhodospira lacustris]|uniref:GTPase family protein n=1 Tax=Ectothiorhodospira lacustris TaxID=2899127 RepID=UPI001EE961D5|nr:GTPase domain-containing protein [Ectothiorhodospira lacustris]MCG5502010.1 GTPase domain-containing protein [Ectothiorhodospira lacustris]
MKRNEGPWERWGALVSALGLAVAPLLVLIPFGALWLWQQGWLLHWLGIAAVLGGLVYGTGWWLQRRALQGRDTTTDDETPVSAPDDDWSGRDLAAWETVQRLAGEVEPRILSDQHLMLATARQTIEQVARHYHPEERHAIWGFTVPEALLLTERVSARLRRVMLDHVPGAHMIRANQVMRLWELQPAALTGARWLGHLTQVYRTVRWINPATAVLAAAREKMISAMLGEAGEYLRRRGARIWVEEVGRAAIELYSGRLRVDDRTEDAKAAAQARGPGVPPAPPPGPVRVTVAGQTNAGKSSLVNALLGTRASGVDALPLTRTPGSYVLQRDGAEELVLIDTPGLENRAQLRALIDTLAESDCILWVVPAHRADRALDLEALTTLRRTLERMPGRILPPVMVVLSHVDRLSPAREWAPPYDLEHPDRPKAAAMRGAMEAVARDLDIPPALIVPARLDSLETAWQVDRIWAVLLGQLDRSHRARALRIARAALGGDWKRVWRQARRAGAEVTRQLIRKG